MATITNRVDYKRTVYNKIISTLMEYRPAWVRRLVFSGFRFCAWLAEARVRQSGCSRLLGQPLEIMGLSFNNPVGVAAGFDRHGRIGRRIGYLGFSHIEIGTLSPEQLPVWVDQGRANGENTPVILGVNIGPNPGTPLSKIQDEFLYCLRQAWNYADYIAINLCNPVTAKLLAAENESLLYRLLAELKRQQIALGVQTGRYIPVAIKMKLEPENTRLPPAVDLLKQMDFDALIAVIDAGKPATPAKVNRWLYREHQLQACELIGRLHTALEGGLPIISVGGICSLQDAQRRLDAGASLVQIHNGLVYHGPRIVKSLRTFWE